VINENKFIRKKSPASECPRAVKSFAVVVPTVVDVGDVDGAGSAGIDHEDAGGGVPAVLTLASTMSPVPASRPLR
jgi:hypothetical protein